MWRSSRDHDFRLFEPLIPSRKWTLPKRLGKFETYFHFVSGFGRSFLTTEIASHHQSHQNQGFLRILMKSMDFKILDVAIITRSRLQTETDYSTVDSTPEMDFSQAFENFLNKCSRFSVTERCFE